MINLTVGTIRLINLCVQKPISLFWMKSDLKNRTLFFVSQWKDNIFVCTLMTRISVYKEKVVGKQQTEPQTSVYVKVWPFHCGFIWCPEIKFNHMLFSSLWFSMSFQFSSFDVSSSYNCFKITIRIHFHFKRLAYRMWNYYHSNPLLSQSFKFSFSLNFSVLEFFRQIRLSNTHKHKIFSKYLNEFYKKKLFK